MKFLRLTKNIKLKDSSFSEQRRRNATKFAQKILNINNNIIIVYINDDDKKKYYKIIILSKTIRR